jgi:hypothetical protein
MANTTVESVLREARKLTPEERQRLREELALVEMQQTPTPRESLYGVAEHLGPAPSTEDIDEARRELWGNFPRNDI